MKKREHSGEMAAVESRLREELFLEKKKTEALSIIESELRRDLEQAYLDLHESNKKLMDISAWATDVIAERERRDNTLWRKLRKYLKLRARLKGLFSQVKKFLGQTPIGKLIKRQILKKRIQESEIAIADIKRGLLDSEGRLVITFPIITWDFRWQRPQHIVSRLRDHGYSILYLALDLWNLGRRYKNPDEVLPRLGFNQLSEGINQIWLQSATQVNIYTDPLTEDDVFNISTGLEQAARSLSASSIIYLVHFPGWWPVVSRLKEQLGGLVVFDCMDDHAGFSTNSESSVSTETDLVQHADLVVASSEALRKKCAHHNSATIMVKNGTEFEHFYQAAGNGILQPSDESPIIGYFGAISDWFDMEIVEYCALMRPDWRFVLIGSTFGADSARAERIPNINFLGEVSYQELPGYLADFSVCLIPFKLTTLTNATNPVKFYEYLSAGKPIVSTALPELKPYKHDCYLASDKAEFLHNICLALEESGDQTKIQRRIELAKINSWTSRATTIADAIRSLH